MTETTSSLQYRVTDVCPTMGPDGDDTAPWHSYVIENGQSRITGCRPGTRIEVAEHAERFAERLNSRRNNGSSIWTPRSGSKR